MWIFDLFVFIYFISGSGTMIVGPRNTAVVVGQKTEMKCQVDNNWTIRAWATNLTNTVRIEMRIPNKNQSKIAEHYEVDFSNLGYSILYVYSTTLDDAGIYTCEIQRGSDQPPRYSAHLIVFETEPVCSSQHHLLPNASTQGEVTVWMRCTVNFSGYLTPDIEWRQHQDNAEDGEGREITNLADTVIILNSSITSELTANVTANTSGLIYTFKIYFRPMNESQLQFASNAPNYSYTWKIRILDILSNHLPPNSAGPPILVMSLAVSVFASLSVATIIGCICRRQQNKARLANIPDVATSHSGTPLDPVYAEVSRVERKAVNSKQGPSRTSPSAPASNDIQGSRQLNYVGADGTEYMEVNVKGRQPLPARPPTGPNLFSVVEVYASIDHNRSPPIPLKDSRV